MAVALPPLPAIHSARGVLPPHYADQESLIAAFREVWSKQHFNLERLEDLHRSVQVGGRYLALPLAEYPPLLRFAERNDAWIRVALELGERAVREALNAAGLTPRD